MVITKEAENHLQWVSPCLLRKFTINLGGGFTIFVQQCFQYIGTVVSALTSRRHPVLNVCHSISIYFVG